MKNKMVLKGIIKKCLPILKSHGVQKAGIFGSYARREQKKESDVDILVRLKEGDGYFELVGLEQELVRVLGKEVDLVTYNALHPLLRNRILKEEVRII